MVCCTWLIIGKKTRPAVPVVFLTIKVLLLLMEWISLDNFLVVVTLLSWGIRLEVTLNIIWFAENIKNFLKTRLTIN
jgi:hypothetical protein